MTHHLMGVAEIAALLGVSRQRVTQLAREHKTFPPAVAQLAAGPVWESADVERWAETRNTKPGRPQGTEDS